MSKEKSLVKNSIFNIVKIFSIQIFPIISFAYASRILGDTGIGRVNFTRSVISYFSMIAVLGVKYYGIREAAKLRDDKDAFSQFAQEMLIINGCTTILSYCLFFAAMWRIPKLRGYESLLLINSAAIALEGMGMEWMYQAVEEYRYMAFRSVFFQMLSFGALFLFVRKPDDVIPYAIIRLTAASGPNVFNFFNARKYICFKRYENYKIKKHFRPLLGLFAMVLSIELYAVLDSTMLGFMKGDAAVGRYTAAVKACRIINSLITASGAVMIPRFSYYVHRREWEKIESLVGRMYHFAFLLSTPIAIGIFMLSNEIIHLFCGEGFATAGFTMRILAPIVVIIPFSTVANSQIFVPLGKEKLILKSTLTGAVTNFIFNMLLIPRFAENGAAVATVLAETAVTVVCFHNLGRFYKRKQIFSKYSQYWISSIPIIVIVALSLNLSVHYILRLCISISVSAVCYFAVLRGFRNPYLMEAMEMLRDKMSKQGWPDERKSDIRRG